MKEFIKNNYNYLIMFFLLIILAFYFPLTGRSLYWARFDISIISSENFFKIFESSLIADLIFYITCKIKIIRIVFIALVFMCMITVLKNVINKKNKTLIYIALFLLFVVDQSVFKTIYVYLPNFVYYVLAMLLYLIIVSYISNDKLFKLAKWQALLLGLIVSIINPVFTILSLLLTLGNLIYNIIKKEDTNNSLALFLGSVMGSAFMMISSNMAEKIIYIPSITLNIIENVIPNIFSMNFLIYFITLALLLFLSVKVFIKGTRKIKVLDILAVLSVLFFSLVFLLTKNIYLEYIAYILNIVGSYYIINKSNNSIVFKRKNNLIYISKILYIIILAFIVEIGAAYNFPIYIFDILIILNIIDYLLPNNFMEKVWFILSIVILLTNIYIYRNSFIRFKEMNNYIKWHLSCDINNIPLPSKYESDTLYNYIPQDPIDKGSFVEYYKISNTKDYSVYFEE